jgi:hypothetical protein
MMRDDYDDIIIIEPEIEKLAEMASDTEAAYPYNSIEMNERLNKITWEIKNIKKKYKIN